MPVELASGGKTKWNRIRLSIPKSHSFDALCVGNVGIVVNWNTFTLEIKCAGRGSYKRTLSNKYGFPRAYLMRQKAVNGFQTGDLVMAVVTQGKKTGTYTGRVAVRASGYFNISTKEGVVQGINYKCCKLISRNDGYGYEFQTGTA